MLRIVQKSVLRDLQKVPISGHAEMAFVMSNRHHQGAADSVVLDRALQTWWSLDKLHHKSRNLPEPDPDIFAFDNANSHATR